MDEVKNIQLQRMIHHYSWISSWIRSDWTDWEQKGQKLVKRKIFSKAHTLKHTLKVLVTAACSTSSHPFHEKIVLRVNFLDHKRQFLLFLLSLLSFFHSFIHCPPVWSLLLRDFQLQQVNKLQKTLLIIAGTFHRYSEISTVIHCSQRETHNVSNSYSSS